MTDKSITIVYHYFAHYRLPVLNEIASIFSGDSEIFLLADSSSNLPALETIDFSKITIPNLSFKKIKNIWLGPFLWQKGLIKEALNTKSATYIMLGQFNFLSTWVAVPILRLRGIKVFFWSHGVYGNESFFKYIIRVNFYKLANHLLLYGHYSKKLLIRRGFSPNKIDVIYNSLDYKKHLKFRDEYLLSKKNIDKLYNNPYICFIGRLTDIKRLDLLLHSLHQLKKKYNEIINCVIIGTGPAKNSLLKLAEELSIKDSIIFTGAMYEESKISNILYHSEICIAPGNVGLTAMHSLTYGTPVITHDEPKYQMPEFEAIKSGITGDFFKRNDLKDLTSKIHKWLSYSKNHREEIRTNCFKVIDEYYNPVTQASIIKDIVSGEDK